MTEQCPTVHVCVSVSELMYELMLNRFRLVKFISHLSSVSSSPCPGDAPVINH